MTQSLIKLSLKSFWILVLLWAVAAVQVLRSDDPTSSSPTANESPELSAEVAQLF